MGKPAGLLKGASFCAGGAAGRRRRESRSPGPGPPPAGRLPPPAPGAFPAAAALLTGSRGGSRRPALPGPAPGSILPPTGLGCDAPRRCQVRNGPPCPCHPLSPSVTSARPCLRPAVREMAGPRLCPRARRRCGGLWASWVAGDSVCASREPGCRVGARCGGPRGQEAGSPARLFSVASVRRSDGGVTPRPWAGGPLVEGPRLGDGPAQWTWREAGWGNQ